MKKRSLFLSGLLTTSLLVGGVLVGCDQRDDTTDSTDTTDNTDTTDTTDNTDNIDSTDSTDNTDSIDSTETTTPTSYNIALLETNGISATLSATEATAGTKIDITIESVPNYAITSITSDVSGLEISTKSGTAVYSFTMPESDVNLTINVEDIEYEEYALYITNIGDVPSELQASSFYVIGSSVNGSSTYTGLTGIYYCFSNAGNPGNIITFGISDENIDVSTYDLEFTCYYYESNNVNTYSSSALSSSTTNSGKGIQRRMEVYRGISFMTINWANNT